MGDRLAGLDILDDGPFCHRVVQYLDGDLPPDDLLALNVELRAEPVKRDAFVGLCMVRGALIRQGAAVGAEEQSADVGGTLADAMILPALREESIGADLTADAVPLPPVPPIAVAAERHRLGRWVASAAIAAVAVGLPWAFRAGTRSVAVTTGPAARDLVYTPPPVPPAVVTATAGTPVGGPDTIAPHTAMVNGQTIRLTIGVAELTFDCGATVLVRAPAQVRVIDRGWLAVDAGAVYAHVPPAARGFRVTAPGLSAVDRGTNFGVRSAAVGAEVHVFDGVVDVAPVDAAGKPGAAAAVRVTAGRAVGSTAAGPAATAFDPKGFDRNFADVRLAVAAGGTRVGVAGGNPDPRWQIVSSPDHPSGPVTPAFALDRLNGDWVANTAEAGWISPTPQLADARPGEYVYRTSLDLTGFDPATASVRASMAADDQVVAISVNGTPVLLGDPAGHGVTWKSTAVIDLAGTMWRGGPNQVEVVVVNGGFGHPNPSGLLCGWTVTAAPLVRR